MKFLIYKITNQINGRYYIGRHRTSNRDDEYMGSGIGIMNAIKKYGVNNFTKEIIAESWDENSLWELEKIIVDSTVVNDPKSYNMAYGGKSYLHGLKTYDYEAFVQHQKAAGKKGGVSCYNQKNKEEKNDWHKKGYKAGAQKHYQRNSRCVYQLKTNTDEEYILNGVEFRKLCREKGWSYNTLLWHKSLGRTISRGPLKGFQVNKLLQ